jgi:hypothetical protein
MPAVISVSTVVRSWGPSRVITEVSSRGAPLGGASRGLSVCLMTGPPSVVSCFPAETELDPVDRRQLVAQVLDCVAVGPDELVQHLTPGFGPRRGQRLGDEDTDRGLAWLAGRAGYPSARGRLVKP